MVVTVRGVSEWLRVMFIWLSAVAVICGSQVAFGQERYETPQQTNDKIQQLATLASAHPMDTPIGSGALLHIDVFDVPELSRDVRVSVTGDISYPLIPEKIPVAGLSPFQLESKFKQLLIENGLVSHPQVSVVVREQFSEPVSVVGAVRNTTVYQAVRSTTLLEVLSAAGGISDDAGAIVIVTRPVRSDTPRTEPASVTADPKREEQKITIRLQDLLESGDSVYNIPIYGGDTVTVPRAGIVYVLGFGVAQPGGYVLQSHGEQVTVLKAIALAHGLTSFAKADAAVIRRTNPATGQKDEIPVHLNGIQKGKAADVPMQSNDILYVPDSIGKKALARSAQAAFGIGTQVAIYRFP
jgi:polysaccharide biosynthesis/export protein